MKNRLIVLMALLCLFGCQKEDAPTTNTFTEPTPHWVRFDRFKKTVSTNYPIDSPVFNGTYSIKMLNHYEENGVKKVSTYTLFVQIDTGTLYLSGPKKAKYAVITSNRQLDGLHLDFKFDKGYDDISVTPTTVTETTTEILIKNKHTGRDFKISGPEFWKQKFWMIYYDK